MVIMKCRRETLSPAGWLLLVASMLGPASLSDAFAPLSPSLPKLYYPSSSFVERNSVKSTQQILSTRLASTSTEEATTATSSDYRSPQNEIDRRRNIAIISHPDSGKTTMTEKLLLYGGALQEAGAVRQKAEQRSTQSDFMEMEKERGISISSTVMNFDYQGYGIRLMDTPGHEDFSEDTYRALAAADNALMLLDGAKGLEPQTRKLFEVCRMRKLPLFTFVNKLDRPAMSPYEIMDQIEAEFGLETHPILWPIGDGDRFKVRNRFVVCGTALARRLLLEEAPPPFFVIPFSDMLSLVSEGGFRSYHERCTLVHESREAGKEGRSRGGTSGRRSYAQGTHRR